MRLRHALLGAVLLALTGCVKNWVNSTREDAATLAIVFETEHTVLVSGFGDGRDCRNRAILAGQARQEGRAARSEFKIPPAEEFTVLAQFVVGRSWSCNTAASFMPKPRASYAVVLHGGVPVCDMKILREDGRTPAPEPSVRKREWKGTGWASSEAQCR